MFFPKIDIALSAPAEHFDDAKGVIARYARANALDCAEVEGCYKGQTERSMVVACNDFVQVQYLFALAKAWGEESVLLVDSYGKAFLRYCETDEVTLLGRMQRAPYPATIPLPDAYTIKDGVVYWVTPQTHRWN